jgi:hypothetical protein
LQEVEVYIGAFTDEVAVAIPEGGNPKAVDLLPGNGERK